MNGKNEMRKVYQMELREWKYMTQAGSISGNTAQASTSSGGYKKRFEKLLKYHLDKVSKVPMLGFEKLTRKAVTDYGFRLGEIYNISSGKLDRTVIVTVASSGTFYLRIEIDGRIVDSSSYESYEELIASLAYSYLVLPDAGTKEYNDLLTESLNEWKTMNPSTSSKASQPASKSKSQEDRYKKLIAQIDADGISTYKVNKLTGTELDINVSTKLKSDIHVRIIYNPNTDDYILAAGKGLTGGWTYEDILSTLETATVIKNTDLCESAFSIAEDFELYDFLWENI